jgi:hypothetical protein
MKSHELVQRFSVALHALFQRDGELFNLGTDGINEQTLTFRLGLHLANQFPGHNVDCEYNRLWDGKKLCRRFSKSWMKPDVVVHIRQSDKANLLCIEAKKTKHWKDLQHLPEDVGRKLKALTHPDEAYRYALGLAWRIAPSADPSAHDAVWFVFGEPVLTTRLQDFEDQLRSKLELMEVVR